MTISLSDIIKFNASKNAAALGEIGASTVSGKPNYYDTALRQVAGLVAADTACRLVETITVGATTQHITFSGLAGDSDGIYILEGICMTAHVGHTTTYSLWPNSADPGAAATTWLLDITSAAPSSVANILRIGSGTDTVGNTFISGIIHPKSGHQRKFDFMTFRENTAGIIHQCEWSNTANELTSLRLYSNRASGIKVGSKVSLYKRVQA